MLRKRHLFCIGICSTTWCQSYSCSARWRRSNKSVCISSGCRIWCCISTGVMISGSSSDSRNIHSYSFNDSNMPWCWEYLYSGSLSSGYSCTGRFLCCSPGLEILGNISPTFRIPLSVNNRKNHIRSKGRQDTGERIIYIFPEG